MENSNFAKLISNYGSKLWSMFSVFIFIPLYIKFLGVENYGLIGFYALFLGIISFADSGMSSAVIKEFSQESSSNYKYSVFRRLEKLYGLICAIIIVIIFFSAGFIVDHWLSAKNISRLSLIYNVKLIGLGITTQLISSLYFGALFSLNRQVRSNLLQLIWSISRSALVFVLFITFSKSIEIYFIWQIVCNVLYVVVLRFFIMKQLIKESKWKKLTIELDKLPHHITTYLAGMILIAIISAINMQADKLITSSMFELSVFGYYNMASSLSQIPVIIATPLMLFAFPLFSKYSNLKSDTAKVKLLSIFHKIFYLINLAVIVVTLAILFYANDILLLWTKNAVPYNLFSIIVWDIRVLIIGSFFLAIQFPLYYLLLSIGKTKYTIYQGIIQLLFGLPILYFFAYKYGLKGIPIPWLIINFASFIYLFIVVSKRYLSFDSYNFYKNIFVTPIIITLVVNILVYFSYRNLHIHFLPFVIFGSFLSIMVSVVLYNIITKNKILSFKHLYNFPNE